MGNLKLPINLGVERDWELCEGWGSCHKGRVKVLTPEQMLRGKMSLSQEDWSQRAEGWGNRVFEKGIELSRLE